MDVRTKILAWFLEGSLREDGIRRKVVMWEARREVNKFMDSKKWYQSKTLWVNALVGIAGVLTALTSDKGLDPKVVGYVTMVLGLINMGLRLVTDKPIGGGQ